MYHDSLLSRVFSSLPATVPRPPPSPHNRYTKFWSAKSTLYKRVALFLQTIQYTELLWEMAVKRKGEQMRWRVVVFLEVVKALCRLVMMRLTGSRPLIQPPLPERETDPRDPEAEKAEQDGRWDGMETPPLSNEDPAEEGNWTMPRTGLAMPSLPDSSEVTEYLLQKVLKADDIKLPKQLLHRITTYQGQVAEVAWALRPVVYALMMQRWQGKKNWSPWLVGICIDLAARNLAQKDFSERLAGGLRGLTGLEREELKRRGWSMGWWVMRGAFYENITK